MNPNARILDRTLRRSSTESSGPVRVQFWYKDRWMATAPIRIVDGVADDLKYRPKKAIMFDRLVFMHVSNKKPFIHWMPQPVKAEAGQLIHLALGHLKLQDKFGRNILG